MMKKCAISAFIAALAVFANIQNVWAQNITLDSGNRITIDSEEGQMSCIFDGIDYADCVPIDQVHYLVDSENGQMACKWLNGNYGDCIPYGDTSVSESSNVYDPAEQSYVESQANVQQHKSQFVNPTPTQIETVTQENSAQENSVQQTEVQQNNTPQTTYSSSSSSSLYWDDDYEIPNGLTWGVTIGWFGQVQDGDNSLNGLSFGCDLGGKGTHFGGSLDLDLSVNPTEKKFENFWTYSVHGMFMTFWPFTEGMEVVAGIGAGYTGWTLDYEYSTKTLNYDWWYDVYYVEENDYSRADHIKRYLAILII